MVTWGFVVLLLVLKGTIVSRMQSDLTFEHFTEESRAVLFHARVAVSELGGSALTPAHLLIGFLRAEPDVLSRFASNESVTALNEEVIESLRSGSTTALPEGVNIPLSSETERVFRRAIELAQAGADGSVRPEHLLCGFFVTPNETVTTLLRSYNISENNVCAHLRSIGL
jgi:ATP-dependent Clp protease ATP-binding subunit ClpA